ncbi:MAG: TRAP transporter small permease [Alkalicoccus sp.]|nr:MAG: TRAP transporter small permease [Alkalicoccus sp.]
MTKRKDAALYLRYACSLMLLTIIVITLAQVFFRFILNSPFVWTDELSRFLLIWLVFLGAGVVSYDDKHLSVNLFQEMMTPKWKLVTDILMRSVIIIFLVIVAYTSIPIVTAAHGSASGALGIPTSYWRAAAPVSCLLMIGYTVLRTAIDIKDYKQAEHA